MKRKLFLLLFCSLFFLFLAPSCKNKSEQAAKTISKAEWTQDSVYIWLADQKNYNDETYKDSFRFYFDQNIRQKNFDQAGHYLIAYAYSLRGMMHYDSTFNHIASQFYEQYEDQLKEDTKSFLTYYLGLQNLYIQQLERSSFWLKKSIQPLATEKYHQQIQGFALFSLGQNENLLKNHEQAEEYLMKALKVFQEVGDVKNPGNIYLLLHDIAYKNYQYEKAEEYLDLALQIFKQENNQFGVYSAYSFYVHYFVGRNDTMKAIQYIDSLIEYAKVYENMPLYHRAIQIQLTAFKFIGLKKSDSALHYLQLAKRTTDTIPRQELKMRTFFQEILYANVFEKDLLNPKETEDFYEMMARQDPPNRQQLSQMSYVLYNHYQKNGDYKKANIWSRFLVNDNEFLTESRMKGKLFELEKKYESEQKEKTILEQQQQLDKTTKLIYLLIIGIIVITFFLLGIYFKTKYNAISREKKITERFTTQLLTQTEEERKRIASDLHDSVSNELVQLRHSINVENNSLKSRIDNILEEVRNISRNISPTLFDKIGLEQSIEQLTERIQNQHQFFLTAHINYKNSLSSAKELQIYRIIQEATTNILKHAKAIAGAIIIQEHPDQIELQIKDNGQGFDVDRMLAKGDCFGIINIIERAKLIGGSTSFKSNNKGTVITIKIPK